MTKLFLCTLLLSCISFKISAQHFCGQAEVTEQFFKMHPELKAQFLKSQKTLRSPEEKRKSNNSTTAEPDFMIPVVFHVVHQGGIENISDEQIMDAVRILNRDYQKQNADTSVIVPAFQNNIARVNFGFKLARIDPNGQCTNGITRHLSPKTNWDANNLNDFIYSWPRNKYLNIYVVKTLNIAATAYSFLPEIPVPASADAIVSMHQMVGSIGTGNTTANSRVLTHEVAHWFGIQHIWGTSNQPGVACGDDEVDDTPITKGFSTCATSNTGICNPGIVENVQNYMDYSPCKIMFTNGQKDRMLSYISGSLNGRNNLSSTANLLATGISGPAYVCNPSVDFKTNGLKKCLETSVTFTSFTNTGQVSGTRLWTFEGGNPATSADSIVEVTYASPGIYNVSLEVTTSGGATTEMRNDYISIEDGSHGEQAPYAFDFETDSLLAKLRVVNFDSQSIEWKPFSASGAMATGKCFTINSYNDFLELSGEKDAFELPYLNLSGLEEINLSYYYAYARLTTAHRDSFKVQYSLDCGGNWITIAGLPTTVQMAAASGSVNTDEFIPNSGQWVQQVIPAARLNPLAHQNGVKIRFLFVKDITKTLTNNLYIDQIQLNGTVTGTNPLLSKRHIAIYPNPSTGSFTVSMSNQNYTLPEAQLFDVKGRELPGLVEKTQAGEMVINSGSTLNKGVYMLMLNLDGQMFPQKLVVN